MSRQNAPFASEYTSAQNVVETGFFPSPDEKPQMIRTWCGTICFVKAFWCGGRREESRLYHILGGGILGLRQEESRLYYILGGGILGLRREESRLYCILGLGGDYFTSLTRSFPSVKSRIFWRVVTAMLWVASRVKNAWWEVTMTLGIIRRRASLSSSIILSERSS